MKFLVTESEKQICLISDNIILEDDDVYYAWDDLTPHNVTRANSTDPLEIIEVPEGTELPEDDYIISKYCYTVEDGFTVYPGWQEDEI